MKKTALILIAAMVACAAVAKPKIYKSTMTLSSVSASATGATNTFRAVEGYVDEVEAYVTDGVSTSTVTVTVQPADSEASTVAAYNLATASVTDSQTWRPRFDGTDSDGNSLTDDPPSRRLLIGDQIKFIVADSPTNKVWKLRIKYDDGR